MRAHNMGLCSDKYLSHVLIISIYLYMWNHINYIGIRTASCADRSRPAPCREDKGNPTHLGMIEI